MCQQAGGGCKKLTKSWGLLALRLVIGFIFIYLGSGKIGANHAMATGMFDKAVGLPGGGSFWAYFVGTVEVVGGAMVLLGAFARYAAVPLTIVLLVAMLTVHRGGPINGYFLPLSMLGGVLAILGGGAGKFRVLKTECCCKMCKADAASDSQSGGCCGGGGCGGCDEKKDEVKK